MYHALFQNKLFSLSNYPWSVPYSWVLRNREMFHRTYRYKQLKKVEGNTRRIKSASQKTILLHMAEKLDKIRSYTYQSMFGPVEMVFFSTAWKQASLTGPISSPSRSRRSLNWITRTTKALVSAESVNYSIYYMYMYGTCLICIVEDPFESKFWQHNISRDFAIFNVKFQLLLPIHVPSLHWFGIGLAAGFGLQYCEAGRLK